MNDTSPEIERMYRERIMALSAEERLVMATSMFDTARALVLSSFPADLPPHEVKRRLFTRFYGHELDLDPAVLFPDPQAAREPRA